MGWIKLVMSLDSAPNSPSHFIRVEADALHALANRLDAEMRPALDRAFTLIAETTAAGHRVAVTGIGKSGIIARKIVATLNSTGTPAVFLHPVEALHGDLGMLTSGDLALALSYSGETEELIRLLPVFARLEMPIVSFTGSLKSTLAQASTVTLDVSVSEEACALNLAPTASTTAMLALGDAIALELSRRSNFQPQNFADLHPGGPLGRRLARVRDIMHTGDAMPRVATNTPMPEVIHEMSRKRLGMTTVLKPTPKSAKQPGFLLAGIISDGDLRRLLERVGPHSLDRTAGDIMNRTPQTIAPTAFATDALAHMEEKKITSLVVVNEGLVEGVIHLHDLWQQSPS
jgi:arabinose-5-phosphate isomerase